MNEVEQLENSIRYYAEKYYSGNPEIDDIQFDTLVDKLRKLNPNSRALKTGWGFEVKGDKVKHKYSHIGSLDKTKTFEDIPDRFYGRKVYISPKLDGLSAVAYFENGVLVKGITRGNGEYGKDITNKLRIIIGTEIPDKSFTGAIRGELVIHELNWKMLNAKYNGLISSRNFAAGIINRKEIDEDIDKIDLVTYKVTGQELNSQFKTKEDMLKWLTDNFRNVVPIYYYPELNKTSWEEYHENTFEEFKRMGYDLDGLVLTNEEVIYNTQTQGYIFDEVAFKFNAQTEETTINHIEWTLSRTQRLVPVAVVEPVELSGAIVERATCNNAQMVKDMGIGSGAKIHLQRSNEVIPMIVDVIDEVKVELPTVCPVCGKSLSWIGVDLKCLNPDCNNIKLSDLQQWCENVGETDGLQWTLMKQYLDYYGIASVDELYNKQQIVLIDLQSKELSKTEQKIKQFFNKIYFEEIPITKALVGLNIPRLGGKTAELLGKNKDLITDLLLFAIYGELPNLKDREINYGKLRERSLELLKSATTEAIFQNLKKYVNLRYLYGNFIDSESRIQFVQNSSVSSEELQYVAVTGSLNTMKRKDFEQYIKQYGYELTGNIKKCKYLITNNPDSGSSKNKEAQKYGVQIITEVDFLNNL